MEGAVGLTQVKEGGGGPEIKTREKSISGRGQSL